MRKIVILLLINGLTSIFSHGQSLFTETFEGCTLDRFGLESDSVTVRISNEQLISTITSCFDEKTQNKIRGKLTLQVLVDPNGSSCLLSVKNDTNIKTSKMNLKRVIDEQLHWNSIEKRMSPVIALNFTEKGIAFKRLGMNAKKGVHELLDK